MFGGKRLGEVPSTDAKTLPGKTIEVSLPEVVPQSQKHFVMLKFKVSNIEGTDASTKFHGFNIAREQAFRITRKRTQKVELVSEMETKDDWKLQFTTVLVLNRKTNVTVGNRIRNEVDAFLKDFGSKTPLDEVVKSVTAGMAQKNLKKVCNKIYPVRFSEISKIEVLSPGKA